MQLTFNDNLQEFLKINDLPFDTWNEVADFLAVDYINGGAKDAIKRSLMPLHMQQQPAPAAAPQPQQLDVFKLFADQLNPYFKSPQLDESQVIELINKYSKPYTAKTEIFINNELKAVVPGRQHKQFSKVLRIMSAGLNVYLYGDAGTGKTQLAENAAIALNKQFYCISVCSQSTKSDLLGFMNAAGTYTPTLFRKAYEEGGIFLIDEIDNGNPNVLAVLNAALANGYCAFPDGMIKRHADFQFIASANTFGTGANRQYVGRNQLDAATLNRFVQVCIDYDEELEIELWGEIAATVQRARRKLAGERVIISMRNIANAASLINAGFTKDEAFGIAVIETIPDNLRSRI